jgi:acyl-CoA reductase-like NAD-dependent aldehyde dehydrogenase
LKPANQTPLSALFIAELFAEAGLPAGALNVVTGSGSIIGDVIVTDERVQMVTFTGSPEVGLHIRGRAGLKRVTLELGSNSALIVDRDVDLSKRIKRCVQGAFSFQGQVCISLQRIYVHRQLYEPFLAQFIAETKKLKAGNPLHEDTDVSALITPKDTARLLSWIAEAQSSGAEVVCGGTEEHGILQPTIMVNVRSDLKVSCQEAFGPIVLVDSFDTMEEAIHKVNDSRFGLQAGVYTDNLHTALEAVSQLHVGGVIVNDIPTFRVDHMPYGGVKESGMGREGVKYAIEEMTELKLVVFNRND